MTKRVFFTLILYITACLPCFAQDVAVHKLSIDDIPKIVLQNNTDIKVKDYGRQIAEAKIMSSAGEFDTDIISKLSLGRELDPEASAFASPEVSKRENETLAVGIGSKFFTGAAYELKFSTTRAKTNSSFAGLNPEFSSNLALLISQPLLKEFGKDINKRNITISKHNKEISEQEFKGLVIASISRALDYYWELVFVTQELQVKKESLNLAMKFKNLVEIELEIGTLTSLDLLEAQAEVASRQEGVIIEQNRLLDTGDRLKKLLGIKEGTLELSSLPINQVKQADVKLDDEKHLSMAFKQRPDYQQAKTNLKNKKIELRYFKNQTYPSIDLVASLQLNGLSGDASPVSFGSDPPKISSFKGSYIDSIKEMTSGKYYSWETGILFSLPLQNNSAKANLMQAKLELERSLLAIKSIEELIILEVKTATRKINSSIQRIEATRLSSRLARRKLAAQEKRFKIGGSTTFKLLEFQRDLAEEKSREIKALTDYMRAKIKLDRVTGSTLEKNNIAIR